MEDSDLCLVVTIVVEDTELYLHKKSSLSILPRECVNSRVTLSFATRTHDHSQVQGRRPHHWRLFCLQVDLHLMASTSTTPTLTPDSTGTGTSSPDPSTAKKARRGAVYPNMTANKPQKPFSRSAAKRESVMALGSIEHLQHYFTKTGIAPKKK